MISEGEFTYEIDGEKVKTVQEFYKKTNNKNYDLRIDGSNITATSKSEPFFLDEIVSSSFSPKNKKEDLELLKSKIDASKDIYIGIEDISRMINNNTGEVITVHLPLDWKCDNTGGSIFERVQDSTTSNQNPLDAYNAITGHSTRHKAGKVIDYSKNGKKETKNKVDYSEIDFDFITQLAKRMSKNKGKYVVNNWKLPTDKEELKQALLRHVLEVIKGNYADDGDELGHLEAIALNAQFLNYQLKNKL